ncbi:hypothetical protein L2E82_18330 [Cichorium intybus]|uniref:Uncharacterized protein n=1 Tax=Cichorium intybus TaxID=13427 RepID=A0ACB9FAB2_CICIN|nr:hypothetical protein L2E82_18330 [Cichorium intybus]
MFWADETAKYHYNVFGDVVSFDATFSTNRYHMVFVPFTGIDNHKRCVTFGAGLLSKEDTDSYIWLLRCFLKAFGKQPTLILSDQDPAMKKAVEEVFPLSHHRLCMWHITAKFPKKVMHNSLNLSWEVANNPVFKRQINDSQFKVRYQKDDKLFFCSCKHFEHVGVLCRHIFCVLKFYGYDRIPERYVLQRWCRDVIPSELLRRRFNTLEAGVNVEKTAMDIYMTVDQCVAGLSHDNVKLEEYLEEITKLKSKFGVGGDANETVNKQSNYEKALGVSIPDTIEIQNPANIRNKGSGSRGKRIKSKKEMIAIESEKPKRQCRLCKEWVHHDTRNCPLRKKENKEQKGDDCN